MSKTNNDTLEKVTNNKHKLEKTTTKSNRKKQQ